MKFTLEFVVGIAYIGVMVGIAWNSVGQISPPGPYPWHLPLAMLVVTGGPFILGYIAGKRS